MTMVENVLVKLSLDSKQARIQAKAFMGVMRNIQRLSANSFYVAKRVTQQFSQMSAKTKALYQTGAIPNINAELKTLGSKTLPKVTNASDVMNAAVGRATEKFEAMKKPQRELTRKQNLMNKQMNGGAAGLIRNAELMQDLENKHNSFGRALLMSGGDLKKFNDGGGEFSNRFARVGNKLRMATTGLKGFKMEMLGVMFFGMAMQRMFSGMLKPAANLFGVMELWGEMLAVVFLPTIQALMPYFIDFFKYMVDLDPASKKMIGTFALIGIAIGTFLFIFGTLVLGVGSLLVMFSGGTFTTISLFIVALIGIGVTVVGLVKIIKNWGEDWEEVGKGIGLVLIGIGLVLLLFVGWWALIPIAVGAIVLLLISHWDKFSLYMEGIWIQLKMGFRLVMMDMLMTLRDFYDKMSDMPVFGAIFAKASAVVTKSLNKQTLAFASLSTEMMRNTLAKDDLGKVEEQNALISAGTTMNDDFMGLSPNQSTASIGTASTRPVVINQNLTISGVGSVEEVKQIMSDEMDSLTQKLTMESN